MIKFVNVSKSYKTKDGKNSTKVFEGVNASFGKTGLVGIYGKDGEGKTTLLSLISGFERADSGEIIIDGLSTKNFNDRQFDSVRANKISFISKDVGIIEHINVLKNVSVSLSFSKNSQKEIECESIEALKLVDMDKYAKEYPDNLTNEQKLRVCIARAIAKNPKIILVDEPCSSVKESHSKQILELLKKASLKSLVIVCTHDKDIYNSCSVKYSLKDGVLNNEDSSINNFLEETTNTKYEKTRFKFLQACVINLANMWKHKVRTLITVLASSFGVIGVCVVLALSTGFSEYIKHVENTTLSSTPITISKYKSQSSQNTQAEQIQAAEIQDKQTKRAEYLSSAINNRRVALNNTLASLLSTNGNQNTDGTKLLNDVPSLKAYLDTNPDNIQDFTSSIEYTYDISPIIFSTAFNKIKEVYPGGLFGSLGTGSSSKKSSRASVSSSVSSFSDYLSDFKVFPENNETYQDNDSLVEGKWPENSNECALVLNSDGTMDDTLAYTLGLKNFTSEITPLIEKYKNGEKVDYPGIYDSYAYSDILGISFKVVNPSQVFIKGTDGIWEDKSLDESFIQNLINNNASELKIVGVVKPADGSKASYVLSSGIYYHPSLNLETMENSKNSQIVQEQLNKPDIDVLTGKTFAWLKSASTITERLDFANIININADMLASCVTLHPEALGLDEKEQKVENEIKMTDEQIAKIMINLFNDPDFQQFIKDLSSSPKFDAAVEESIAKAGTAYAEYCAEEIAEGEIPQEAEIWFSEHGDGYTWTVLIQNSLPDSMKEDVVNFVSKYATRISNFLVQTIETEIKNLISDLEKEIASEEESNGPSLVEFDEAKFAKALKINITENDIQQLGYYLVGSTSHTYDSNLRDFGYAKTDSPITCSIYPKTFSDKEKITNVLDTYNNNKRLEDKESEAISYSDLVGTAVNIIKSAVSVLSGLLIAIIISMSISVVLLVIVICIISTFQRAKEVGVLRALGACKIDIFLLFNIETFLIGFISGVFGVLVAAAISAGINGATIHSSIAFNLAHMTPQIVIGGIVVSSIVAIIAGIIPSILAARRSVK